MANLDGPCRMPLLGMNEAEVKMMEYVRMGMLGDPSSKLGYEMGKMMDVMLSLSRFLATAYMLPVFRAARIIEGSFRSHGHCMMMLCVWVSLDASRWLQDTDSISRHRCP